MANIKPLGTLADKWARRASISTPEYQAGVQNPRRDWAQETTAAAPAYRQGVQDAIQKGRFEKGVSRAGTSKWQENTLAKGPQRFSEGINQSIGEWQAGFAPYHDTISKVQLPARGPKGSPQNLQRVAAITNALRARFEQESNK